jgi:hypothetical protein
MAVVAATTTTSAAITTTTARTTAAVNAPVASFADIGVMKLQIVATTLIMTTTEHSHSANVASTSSNNEPPHWIIDSGATDHLTSDHERLNVRERYGGRIMSK